MADKELITQGQLVDAVGRTNEEIKKVDSENDAIMAAHLNDKANPHGVTTSQIGAVPTTRKINGKPLSSDITLTPTDFGADDSGAAAAVQANLDTHTSNKSNPHGVTKAQVGLGNVPNVATNDQTPTYTEASSLAKLTSGEKLSAAFGKIAKAITDLIAHLANKSNPHGVTAAQVGADPSGTAATAVSGHNTNTAAHNDIRLLIEGLTTRLNALADSDDTTLDQMSELVAYMKANKTLIDSITTSKVSVTDIINNLTTNVAGKPLSAAQGVALKGLIDDLQSALDSHTGNGTVHITSTERTNWADANSKKHTHSNKTVLDGITAALISAWNAAKTHADSAHDYLPLSGGDLTGALNGKAITGTSLATSGATSLASYTKVAVLNDSGVVHYTTIANLLNALGIDEIVIQKTDVSLAAASWTSASSENADYPYKYSLSVSGVTADMVADLAIASGSANAAAEAGMMASTDTIAGYVVFRSRTKPTVAIAGTLTVKKAV